VYPQRVAIVVILVLSLGMLSSMAMVNPSLVDELTGKFGLSAASDLQFSTFIGTSDYDYVNDVALDAEGNIYLVGTTWSTDFPTTAGSYRPWHTGGNYWEMDDAFVMKLSSDGQEIIYSTYLGGSSIDSGIDIAVDDEGCAYVVGGTTSPDFPTVNAYDSTYNGVEDCFVAKLSANGSDLLFSTFVGGSDEDHPYAISVDDTGNSIVVGRTRSSNFPVITTNTLPGCLSRGGPEDGFVCKLSPDGSEVEYSMYLGGAETTDEARGVATDSNGNVVVVGSTGSTDFPIVNAYDDTLSGIWDSVIVRLNATGHILFSTYYGGTELDGASAVSLDDAGSIYFSGIVKGGIFPKVGVNDEIFNGTWGISLVVMNSSGSEVTFSGVLENSGSEDFSPWCSGIFLVSEREVWLAGTTECSSFPTTENAFDRTVNGEDGFFVMIDPTSGSLRYSSLFGGTSDDALGGIAVTSNGDVVCAGRTASANLPNKNALISVRPGEQDGFVFRMTVDNSMYLLGLIVLGVAGIGAIIVIIAVVTLRSRRK